MTQFRPLILRRILAYILFGLGFITVTFFRNYKGSFISHEFLYWLVGLFFLLIGWAILRYTPPINEQLRKEQVAKMISDLKINGEKIKIELSKCELKSNDYSEEREIPSDKALTTSYTNDMKAINILTGNEMDNVQIVNVFQSILIYNNKYMGKTETFTSGIIPTEHTTLLFKIASQKTTFIYVDKLDRSKYYFDLEFLSN